MSNYEYEDDDDDITTESPQSNDLVKQLRKENVRLRGHVEHLRDLLLAAIADDGRWHSEAVTWLDQNDAEFSGQFNAALV